MTTLRGGFTTGSCATAAAKAAVMMLCGRDPGDDIMITLPDGARATFELHEKRRGKGCATVSVIKDAGDDPDVTHGATIVVTACRCEGQAVVFKAGKGVGTVTLPGLQVPPGEPAINPVPRQMMTAAVREVTEQGVELTVSVPQGEALAEKTFNPKLGVVGGISIIGTTGRVRPYSCEAIRQSLKCALDIAAATGVRDPVLVPGNIGARAARKRFVLGDHQLVSAGNEWGFMLDATAHHDFAHVLVLGHPGKLAKLADGHWDTHSARSPSAVSFVRSVANDIFGHEAAEAATVQGIFDELNSGEKRELAEALCSRIQKAIGERTHWAQTRLAVILTDMKGRALAQAGDTRPWKEAS